jgi:repressor LexA
VHPCTSIDHPGQPYAVTVGNAVATVKRVKVLGNGLELMPDSTDVTYHSLLFDFADADTPKVGIIGRVVWYCLPINWRFD